ncbi:MAG: hypothetical protein ACFFD1_09840 [Candidatus Thorarchaeota archaeon]
MKFDVNKFDSNRLQAIITIEPNNLVFPVHSILLTTLIPPIFFFFSYELINLFPDLFLIPKITDIYNFDVAIILGLVGFSIVTVYWYWVWKKYYYYENTFNFDLDKQENLVLITRNTPMSNGIDSYKFPLDGLKNIIIGQSTDGNAIGWSIVISLLKKSRKRVKLENFSLYVVNDDSLLDLYEIGLELKSYLSQMDLLPLLRISDIFLRKVKEKQESITK